MKHYRNYLIIAALTSFGFTGCTSSINTLSPAAQHYEKPTPAKSAAFQETMMKVALSTRDDANYNKIELDTPEKKAWFKNLMYRLWDRQITRNQFIAEGLSKYPTHRYEFAYVANGFQKHS